MAAVPVAVDFQHPTLDDQIVLGGESIQSLTDEGGRVRRLGQRGQRDARQDESEHHAGYSHARLLRQKELRAPERPASHRAGIDETQGSVSARGPWGGPHGDGPKNTSMSMDGT